MLHRTPLCGQLSLRDSRRFVQCQLCPDISGSFGITGNDADRGFSTSHTDGCFTTKTTSLGGLDSGASSYRTGIPYFVASRVSSIFGGSSGVAVSAVYTLIIIKA